MKPGKSTITLADILNDLQRKHPSGQAKLPDGDLATVVMNNQPEVIDALSYELLEQVDAIKGPDELDKLDSVVRQLETIDTLHSSFNPLNIATAQAVILLDRKRAAFLNATVRPGRGKHKLPAGVSAKKKERMTALLKVPERVMNQYFAEEKAKPKPEITRKGLLDYADNERCVSAKASKSKAQEEANTLFYGTAKHRTKYKQNCRIFHGDFMSLDMTGSPIKRGEKPIAIISDPPYKDEWFVPDETGTSLWQRFAVWSLQHLAKDGTLAVMVGTKWLDKAMTAILAAEWEEQRWEYRWTIAVQYLNFDYNHGRRVKPFWKPVVVFKRKGDKIPKWSNIGGDKIPDKTQKPESDSVVDGDGDKIPDTIREPQSVDDGDWIKAGKRDKPHGRWQQDQETFERLIGYFTPPKPIVLVCDPFTGYGTTAAACMKLARRFVGAEIRPIAGAKPPPPAKSGSDDNDEDDETKPCWNQANEDAKAALRERQQEQQAKSSYT